MPTPRVLRSSALGGPLGLVAALALLSPGAAAAADPAATASDGDRRNVILLIGDGMGYNSVDIGSLYEHGESAYQSVADNPFLGAGGQSSTASQVYQHFPVQLGVETGYVFSQPYATIDAWASPWHATRANPVERLNVTDSGAAATAMSTGVRTRGGYLGLDRDENRLVDMVDTASAQGMATGVVTSGRFWADTAAGFAVHADDGETAEIIDQMLFHPDLDVIMGGGHPGYTNTGRPKEGFFGSFPEDVWDALHGGPEVEGLPDWTLVEERVDFRRLRAPGNVARLSDRVLGLAQTDGALFHDRPGRTDIPFEEPMARNVVRLDEMATAALSILNERSDTGFFTMIEAATIDSAAHNGELGRQIEEQVAFNRTVEAVVRWVETRSSWEETTVIVTSDHETGNLWGTGTLAAEDFMPVTGAAGEVPQAEYTDFTDVDPDDPDQPPHYHSHQLVPLYARGGNAADLVAAATSTDPVRGAYLQNTDIALVIRDHLRSGGGS